MWLVGTATVTTQGPHGSLRHDERRVGTSIWPKLGTQTWPPVGTFSWPRTRPAGEEGGMHRQTVAKLVARGDLSSRGQGTWGSLDRDEVVALGVARREAEDRRHRERVARRPRGRSGQPPE